MSNDEHGPSTTVVLLCLTFSLALLGLEAYVIHYIAPTLSTKGWGIALAATVGYLLVAHVIRPNPDHSDMGFAGGMIDNPFSISDDINRFLLFLQLVLLPGQFVAYSFKRSLQLLLR